MTCSKKKTPTITLKGFIRFYRFYRVFFFFDYADETIKYRHEIKVLMNTLPAA